MENSNNDIDKEITITLENGKTSKGEIIFTFELNGDNFILYELDDKAYAAKLNDDDSLSAVNYDEWKIVEKAYNEYMILNEEE